MGHSQLSPCNVDLSSKENVSHNIPNEYEKTQEKSFKVLKDLDHSPYDPGMMGNTPEDNLVFEATPEVCDIVLESNQQSVERDQSFNSKRG